MIYDLVIGAYIIIMHNSCNIYTRVLYVLKYRILSKKTILFYNFKYNSYSNFKSW